MVNQSLNQLNEEAMKDFAKSFDTVLMFCEGDASIGDRAGPPSAVDILKKHGKKILYFSRDCCLSRSEICENMRKMNYDLTPNEIVSMASLMARYLKIRLGDKKVYVIASSGISEELTAVGLRNFGIGPDYLTTDLATFVHSYKDDPEMGAVVVGFDEHFSYPKMLRAASYLSVTNVIHVACTQRTKITAALVACIETCSEKKALVFDASPSIISDTLIEGYRIVPERTLIVTPEKRDDCDLAGFQRFTHFWSTSDDVALSLLEPSQESHEFPRRSNVSPDDVAEVVSGLQFRKNK